ncbi:MAG TPA: cytochrome P450, partial [Pyrinomonadaceae bacterium]|nr:cytochrome P450 [Pyrinomonadaceae bacterium]
MRSRVSRLLRSSFRHLRSAATPNRATLIPQLINPRLLLVFHGRNDMWPGIGQQLYREELVFRETIQRFSQVVESSMGQSVADFFAGLQTWSTDSLEKKEQRNIVLTSALQLALFELWRSKGIKAEAVMAASAGEVAAGYAAGALTLEESAAVSSSLALLLTRKTSQGRFVCLDVDFERAMQISTTSPVRLDVIVEVSPIETVAYSTSTDLAELQCFLSEQGLSYRVIPSEWGHHTFEPYILTELEEKLYKPQPRPLTLPLYSSVTGGLTYPGSLLRPEHWYSVAATPALFGRSMCAALSDGYNVMLNICAHATLRRGIEQCAKGLNKNILNLDSVRREQAEKKTWTESFKTLSALGLSNAGAKRNGRDQGERRGRGAAINLDLSAMNLLRPDVVRNPYAFYAALRRTGPVHFLKEHEFWLVLDYDDVIHGLKHPQIFSSVRPTVRFDPILVETDAPAHTRVRRILSPYFSPQSLQDLEAFARYYALKLLNAGDRSAEFDLVENFAEPLAEMTIGRFLGFSEEETEELRLCLAPLRHPSDSSLYQVLEEWMRDYLNRVRPNSDQSLGHQLMRGEGEAALGPEEAVGLMKLLWSAGTQTTGNLIASSTLLLLGHPNVRTKLQDDTNLLPTFIEESLRFEAPELMSWRVTREEVELSGVSIPAGAEVRLCIASANRDPKHFADPDNLSLQRKVNNHL